MCMYAQASWYDLLDLDLFMLQGGCDASTLLWTALPELIGMTLKTGSDEIVHHCRLR